MNKIEILELIITASAFLLFISCAIVLFKGTYKRK